MSDRTERLIIWERLRNAVSQGLVRVPIDCSETENDRQREITAIAKSCQGCKYWVGQVQGGRLFACAMHPYGQLGCPDKEMGELYDTENSVHKLGKVRRVLS